MMSADKDISEQKHQGILGSPEGEPRISQDNYFKSSRKRAAISSLTTPEPPKIVVILAELAVIKLTVFSGTILLTNKMPVWSLAARTAPARVSANSAPVATYKC